MRRPALGFIFVTLVLDILGIGLVIPILPRLVESLAPGGITAYGLATEGWMIYTIIVFASLSGVTGPAVQGLISRSVDANEQGGVQEALLQPDSQPYAGRRRRPAWIETSISVAGFLAEQSNAGKTLSAEMPLPKSRAKSDFANS